MNFLCIALAVLLAHADSSYTLSGTIEGMDKGWILIGHGGATPRTDSARVERGRFSFSGKVTEPELCDLALSDTKGARLAGPLFFLDDGLLTLTAKKDAFSAAVVSGVPVQDEYRQFSAGESAVKDLKQQKQLAKTFVQAHPHSYASALALLEYFSFNTDADELDGLYKGLDLPVQQSRLGLQVKEVIDGTKLTAVGNPAPPFTQNDVDGKPVSLSSFRGSYVFVDFWASWCGPCRLENPHVVKVFHQYHDKGFAVVGVSLDDQRDRWLEAIKKDKLDWTQLSDLKGNENQVAIEYGVKGIPMNFLMDKEGKIIARGLYGNELEKKLAELLP